jgi:hypothetical protein
LIIFTAKKRKKQGIKHDFMSLDNIQLPSIVIQDLYKNSLVDLNNGKAAIEEIKSTTIPFLGNNEKRICIVVNDENALYLSDALLNFLLGILGACKLSMADVALVNAAKNKTLDYTFLQEQLKAETVLLFGLTAQQMQLPMQFPFYQIQKFNNQAYLSAPELQKLQEDKAEKMQLWNSLKQLFSIV